MPPARGAAARERPPGASHAGCLYVESSAVLRVLLERDAVFVTALREFTRFLTSSLTLVEVRRAIARARREGRLTQPAYVRALRQAQRFAASCAVVELTPAVRERAAAQFPAEPVRSLDAIHLATIVTQADLFAPIVVASCDSRVRDNAEALGYAVVPRKLAAARS